jgi:MFS transporter, DHA2 family, multidrug resistance protein
MRYTALDIGRVFLVAGVAQIVLMPLVGKISPKVDPRYFLLFGVSLVGLSQWLAASLTNQAGFHDLVEPQLVRAVGLAFVFIPLSVASLSHIAPEQRGNATGLFNLTRELGGSLGTAWMGKVVADGMATHGARLAEHISLFDPAVQDQMLVMAKAGLPAEAILQQKVAGQAMVLSFNGGFHLTAIAILCGILLVLLMRRPQAGVEVAGAH